jgi:hypothetical protein
MNDKTSFVRRINDAAARFDSLRSEERKHLQSQVTNFAEFSLQTSSDQGVPVLIEPAQSEKT